MPVSGVRDPHIWRSLGDDGLPAFCLTLEHQWQKSDGPLKVGTKSSKASTRSTGVKRNRMVALPLPGRSHTQCTAALVPFLAGLTASTVPQ